MYSIESMAFTCGHIGKALRALRVERRWTQAELAKHIGVSQPKLSQIERGNASLTAEQLLLVLELFNVGVDHFAPRSARGGSVVQNALVRHGATHLAAASVGALEASSDPNDVVFEVLRAPQSPRHLTALAPLLVWSAERISLPEVASRLQRVGRGLRLGWLLESTLDAMARERSGTNEQRRRARRAKLLIESFLRSGGLTQPEATSPPDLLDRDVRSQRTADELWARAAEPARRWRIITRLQTDDFLFALRSAHEAR